jgi:hypothetical protein
MCKECPIGEFQKYTAQRRCFECPNGKHQQKHGSNGCEDGKSVAAVDGATGDAHRKIDLFNLAPLDRHAAVSAVKLSNLPGLSSAVGDHLDLKHLPSFGGGQVKAMKHKILGLRELSKMKPLRKGGV